MEDIANDLIEELEGKILENTNTVEYDSVNKPEHYASTKIEVIDYIEDKNLGYHLGNVVKYVSRAGRKHSVGKSDLEKELEDLKKASWYLNRRIQQLENGGDVSNG